MRMSEIREDVLNNCKRIKRKSVLEKIERLTAIYAKMDSKKQFAELTDIECDQAQLVLNILRIDNPKLTRGLIGICFAYERKRAENSHSNRKVGNSKGVLP